MEEKSDSNNNIINTNNKNNNLLENEYLNELNIEEDFDEEKRTDLDIIIPKEPTLEEIKLGSKIRCPKSDCFNNCIILINPYSFEVNYDCGAHTDKMDIIKFVKMSGISKEGMEQCCGCEKKYKDLKKNNKKLYKCYCGDNFCDDCKEEHINKNNNEENHNMIDYEDKDFICCCNKKNKNFIDYCVKCHRNLCIACSGKHRTEEHIKKKFGELCQLGKEKKKSLQNKIIIQKQLIKKFNQIVDDWFLRAKNAIEKYKKKLELYNDINDIIFNQYNNTKKYYEAIKNIEYIRYDFDNTVNNLINSENDFKEQNSIMFQILNESINNFISKPKKIQNNNIKEFKKKETFILNGTINHLCNLKKEEMIIVDISNINNHREEICIYKKSNQNQQKMELHLSVNEDNRILNLTELKNGNLLIVKEHQFKIFEITKNSKSIKTIDIVNIKNNEYFIKVIELINGDLVSIIHLGNEDKIIFWKKNLMLGQYIIKKEDQIEKPLEIMEINKFKFVMLSEDNNLYTYDSNTEERKYLYKITMNSLCKKMIKVDEDGILLYYNQSLILFCISSLQIKTFKIKNNIYDICNYGNSHNDFIISLSSDNDHGLSIININLIIYDYFILKKKLIDYVQFPINNVYQINNRNIVISYENKLVFLESE